MAETKFPVPAFHFRVNFDGSELSFVEVSGLDRDVDYLEYRYGSYKTFTRMVWAGLTRPGRLVLKRGVISGDTKLFEHFNELREKQKYFSDSSKKKISEVTVTLLNESEKEVMRWSIKNAIPVKLVGAQLKSNSNEIAIEQMELMFEDMEIG